MSYRKVTRLAPAPRGAQLQGSYTPEYREVPFTNREDVNYVLAQYEGDHQQLGDSGDGIGGLGGPLIVL